VRLLAGQVAIALFGSLALSGCGLGAGPAPSAVGLLVTRDFGARVLRQSGSPTVHGEETAMSLLMRNGSVSTRFGGGFVQSIDGLAGGQEGGEPVDWFYYVNGVQAGRGAAATKLHPGDHVWWDRHDWSQTEQVPAVVGSFPEPFLNGLAGKRLPVRVDCAVVGAGACRTVGARLHADGVPVFTAGISSSGEPLTLHVLVGPWTSIQGDLSAQTIEGGPRASGVYARLSHNGRTLTALDGRGHSTHTLGPGAGLIAATRHGEDAPVWVVTGTDARGVDLAAQAFDTATLQHRFAVAVTSMGAIALPTSP
jgi:hypothetical protein